MARDEFPLKVQRLLYKRVGTVCSNPACGVPTFGPTEEPDKYTNVGVAAHITAASPEGPRFDLNLSQKDRKSASNGIWLCRICDKKIDSDPQQYTVAILKEWKTKAEERARAALGTQRIALDSTTVLAVFRQVPGPPLDTKGPRKRRSLAIRPIQSRRELKNLWVPAEFCEWPHPASARRIDVMCQNLGQRVETNIRGHVDLGKSKIITSVQSHPRKGIRAAGDIMAGKSFISFQVATLLPGEYFECHFAVDPVDIVHATLAYDGCDPSNDAFVFDIINGPDEFLPPETRD